MITELLNKMGYYKKIPKKIAQQVENNLTQKLVEMNSNRYPPMTVYEARQKAKIIVKERMEE